MAISAMTRAEPTPWDVTPSGVARLPIPCVHGTASLPPSPGLCQHLAQEETRGRAPMGSGTWQGSGTGATTPASPASTGGQLCSIACLRWRAMAAPYSNQGSPGALRATHQHCSPSPWHRQGHSGCSPVVHVEEELEVELVHHTADLLPVTLHQLRVVHQLFLCQQGMEIRAGTVGCRAEPPTPPGLPMPCRPVGQRGRMLGNAAGHSGAAGSTPRQDASTSRTLIKAKPPDQAEGIQAGLD